MRTYRTPRCPGGGEVICDSHRTYCRHPMEPLPCRYCRSRRKPQTVERSLMPGSGEHETFVIYPYHREVRGG